LTLNDISHNYGTPVVVETADWYLNDVYNSALTEKDVLQAFDNAMIQEEVLEGQNGGGAGMTCHMFPAGTGTSSRIVTAMPDGTGQKYTIGALTQTNYGHMNDMQIAGVPIGELLLKEGTMTMPTKDPEKPKENALGGKADDGSIVVILMLAFTIIFRVCI
jgi:D-aminopeptidase